jgi:hypothetical protein
MVNNSIAEIERDATPSAEPLQAKKRNFFTTIFPGQISLSGTIRMFRTGKGRRFFVTPSFVDSVDLMAIFGSPFFGAELLLYAFKKVPCF